MSTKVKITKRGQQYYVSQKENYIPFSNLSLCPKPIIALAQSSYDEINIENTLNTLKTPHFSKHQSHLIRMKQIADKQEFFAHGQLTIQSQMDTIAQYSENSCYEQQDSSIKNHQPQFYEDSYQLF